MATFEEVVTLHVKALNDHRAVMEKHIEAMVKHSVAPQPKAAETPVVVAKPAAAAVAETKPVEPTKTVAPTTPAKPSVDDVRIALRAAAEKHGRDAAKELLTKHGAEAVADLKEEKYADVIAAAGGLTKDDF